MWRHVVCVACLSLTACNPEVSFDVDVDGETTVQAGSVLETLLSQFGFESLVSFDISDTQEFANNDVRKEQVTGTRLTRLNLAVVGPSGATIDFIDEIAFAAEAPDVPAAVVARAVVPDGATGFDCALEDVELAPFVRAEAMSITTDVTGRRPDVDTTVRASLSFAVTARVLAD